MTKPFEPTSKDRAAVTTLAAVGNRHEVIARALQIDKKTLRKYFRKELAEARTDANAKMAQSLYVSGLNGNTTAQIFWLKTRGGWREVTHLAHTGPDGEPLTPPVINLGISFRNGGPGLALPEGGRQSEQRYFQSDRTGVYVTPPQDVTSDEPSSSGVVPSNPPENES